ncbi:hypothetical protein DFP72DRAFT_888528 [Ephemerocybe angulata]|uniref:Postreplication repair E3 ubiquitin-protein ligase RAD18 n=1 Tax=Ephemerocybe angulata TaxID=980116 RepID=A0A8H6I6B4_9AGAR|nr:hypothetical protein DFP72DRAFT_888528 [Tulosesus angulatus]
MNSLSTDKFLNELQNVPDPTDFPDQTKAPGLRTLDATFRCSICGDVFDAPVTINCGHCFCSGCLRTYLGTKQECPACRKAANEGHIRPNYVMEEAISAWNESRSYILELISNAQKPPPPSSPSTPRKRKRRRSPSSSSVDVSSIHPSESSSRGPISRTDSSHTSTSMTTDAKGKRRAATSGPSSDVEELLPGNSSSDPTVECPICNRMMPESKVSPHIDRGCQDSPPPKAKPKSQKASVNAWSKLMQQPKAKGKKQKRHGDSEDDEESPLPKVSYATLKDRQLKDLLAEHNLSVNGERSTLEQRHQKWVMLYNANLDRSIHNRKPPSALRQELKKWEDTVLAKRPKKAAVAVEDKEYTKRHKSEFDKLIQQARPRKKQGDGQDTGTEENRQSSPPPPAPGSSRSTSASPRPEEGKRDGAIAHDRVASDDAIVVDE